MTVSQISELFQLFSLISLFSGVVVVVMAGAFYRNALLGVPLALDFWMAAGLLKLTGVPSWSSLLTAALLVIIRKVVVSALISSKKI